MASVASARTRLPHIFPGDHLLHDRVEILQPSRTAKRLTAHVVVVGYHSIAQLDRVGEGVQSVRKGEFVPGYLTIAICISKFSMHTGVRPGNGRGRAKGESPRRAQSTGPPLRRNERRKPRCRYDFPVSPTCAPARSG